MRPNQSQQARYCSLRQVVAAAPKMRKESKKRQARLEAGVHLVHGQRLEVDEQLAGLRQAGERRQPVWRRDQHVAARQEARLAGHLDLIVRQDASHLQRAEEALCVCLAGGTKLRARHKGLWARQR